MGRFAKVVDRIRTRGPSWTVLWYFRWFLSHLLQKIDYRAIAIEKKRFMTGDATVSSLYHTREENRRRWNAYDWSQRGEEWTGAVAEYRGLSPSEWKASLIGKMMKKHIRAGSTTLEIGPGGGRWTEHLAAHVGTLHAADISEKCLAVCRERFRDAPNVRFHLIEDGRLGFIDSDSIDCVWTYDVFVHITPNEIEQYVQEIRRILVPGGVAVVHHSGRYQTISEAEMSFRSHMDAEFFAHIVRGIGLDLVEQDTSLPHKPGDVISIVRKPLGDEGRRARA